MSARRVQLVILCEDRQQEAFLRRFFEASGWEKRSMTVVRSPKGRGSAEQWVRENYALEVKKLRSAPHVARALIVAVDEDMKGARGRETQLADALATAGLEPRGPSESILHAIPARNIETWIAWLSGSSVDEVTEYPRLERERDCGPMVDSLKAMCDARELRESAPPSLERGCTEYRTRLA